MVLTASGRECPICGTIQDNNLFCIDKYALCRCPHCGLASLAPQPTEEELAAHYAGRSDANYSLELARARDIPLLSLYKKVEAYLAGGTGNWLDLGCFDGALLDMAQQRGFTTYGIDRQDQAVKVARETHGENNIVLSNTFCGHFAGIKMDVISAVSVIEHMLNPLEVFEAADSYITAKGLLVVQTPDITSLPGKVLKSYWPCLAAPEHVYYFSKQALSLAGMHAGFELIADYRHWKRLPVKYAFHQLRYFGAKLFSKMWWVEKLLPSKLVIPAYIGEKFFLFKKKP